MADTDTTAAPNQQQQPHTFTQRKAELHSDQQKPQQDRSQGRDQDPGGGSAQRQQQAEEQQGAGGQAVVQPRSLPSPGMVQLLGHLIDRGALSSPEVAEAMSQVDRRTFLEVMEGDVEEAYEDHPLPIGYRQTISAPHMHATALELLRNQLKPGARVLDVGSGSGYLTAVMGLMVRPGGMVLGVEVVGPLAGRSVEAIGRAAPGLLQEGTVRVMQGNVMEAPHLLQSEPPFDAIHVGAAAARLPQDLVSRLAPGGRMVVPVGPHGGVQALTVVDRDRHVGGGVHVHQVMDVGYVPLVGS